MAKTTLTKRWEPVSSSIAYWKSLSRMWEIWWTRTAGNEAVDAARRSRFNALVRFARSQSPFYRDAYHGLPDGELDPRELPVVTKPRLMARFNDWVTDPEINLAGVTAFVADREHIGERYLDRNVPTPAHPQKRRQPLPWQEPQPAEDGSDAATMASVSYREADQDLALLDQSESREVRFPIDCLKAKASLQRHRVERTIVVFGSTRIGEPGTALRRMHALLSISASPERENDRPRMRWTSPG